MQKPTTTTNEELGYTREADGTVTLRMTPADYHFVLMATGHYGVGRYDSHQPRGLAAVNRINRGNPQFTPYDVPDTYQ